MNRFLRYAAFAAGLAAVGWVGFGYVGTHRLALGVTLVIAAFYVMGAIEVQRFGRAVAGLSEALAALPERVDALGPWLADLPASMRHAVRLRIEGERVGLPGPALAPYLTGLLVLLGMLGTFLGMVVTLDGTGLALETAKDLQGIRASLSGPVRGLGLAFGTSIAGVAASAMLGLMSSLVRRDALLATQALDARIATVLRPFSPIHQREETFRLLQRQAEVMPALVDRLQSLIVVVERQGEQLNDRLVDGQERFHDKAEAAYAGLAVLVDRSLKASLVESARLAGTTLQPIVEATMAGIAREAAALHGDVSRDAAGLHEKVARDAAALQENLVRAAMALHENASRDAAASHRQASDDAAALHDRLAADLAALIEHTARDASALHEAASRGATAMFESVSRDAADLHGTVARDAAALRAQVAQETAALHEKVAGDAAALHRDVARDAADLHRSVAGQAADMQQGVAERSVALAQDMAREATTLAAGVAQEATALQARIGVELEHRLDGLAARFEAVTATTSGLWEGALDRHRAAGEALTADLRQTVDRIAATFERHSASLLDEVGRSAAHTIGELRERLADSLAGDTAMLDERRRVMEALGSLMESATRASTDQRAAIEAMVGAATGLMDRAGLQFADSADRAGQQFADNADRAGETLATAAAEITGSAIEVASLGEAFGTSVQRFGESNEQLMAQLQSIERALGKSLARSDDQLAYYVAQAREVIDLSLMSQKQIVEDLQQIAGRQAAASAA